MSLKCDSFPGEDPPGNPAPPSESTGRRRRDPREQHCQPRRPGRVRACTGSACSSRRQPVRSSWPTSCRSRCRRTGRAAPSPPGTRGPPPSARVGRGGGDANRKPNRVHVPALPWGWALAACLELVDEGKVVAADEFHDLMDRGKEEVERVQKCGDEGEGGEGAGRGRWRVGGGGRGASAP